MYIRSLFRAAVHTELRRVIFQRKIIIGLRPRVSGLQLVRQKHWNRDVNAAVNIRKAAEEWCNSQSRPLHLRQSRANICVNQHEQPNGGITLAIQENFP